MASKMIRSLVISSAILVKSVEGYYCEWDLCGAEQYCCGDNSCCDYVYSMWYFWIAVLFLVILVSACGGFFRYCYFNKSQMNIHRLGSNSPMKSGEIDEMSQPLVWDVESPPSYPSYKQTQLGGYPPPHEPPPPYSQTGHKQSDSYIYP